MVTEISIVERAKHEGYRPVSREEFEKYTHERIEFYQNQLKKAEGMRDGKIGNPLPEMIEDNDIEDMIDDFKNRISNSKNELFYSILCGDKEIAFTKNANGQPSIYVMGKFNVENLRKWESEISVAYQ